MPEIIVYSSDYCAPCRLVKQHLSGKGHEYVEKNVSHDEAGKAELFALGLSTLPVTVIGDQVIKGFDAAALDEALAKLRS